MQAECPHCRKPIELVDAGGIARDFGISQNMMQHAKKLGRFPKPWIEFNNRAVWLRSAIEAYVASRNRQKIERAAETIGATLAGLSESERAEMERLLEGITSAAQTRPARSRSRAR